MTTHRTTMLQKNIRTKQLLAQMLEDVRYGPYEETILDNWMDLAIILGKYCPKWIFEEEGKTKQEIKLWNLLTDDTRERKFIGIENES